MAQIKRLTAHQLRMLQRLYDGLPLPPPYVCGSHLDPAGARYCLLAVIERGLLAPDGLTLTDDGLATLAHRLGRARPKTAPSPTTAAALAAQRLAANRRREKDDQRRRTLESEAARITAGGVPSRCVRHGKLSWPTEEMANAARRDSLQTGVYDPGLVVYRCDRGDWWHLGHEGGWQSLQRRLEREGAALDERGLLLASGVATEVAV